MLYFQVPFSQLLYAINGKFVALTRVADEEVNNYGTCILKQNE